ncbi:hypothetical protein niasHT_009697 [Heterodera trifolii]|uniref:Uncharacterized protein n=1 Tax=Heterodera trifolii TaxID=157864 RepID=A0ABD2MDH8_9BILA
MKFIPVTVHLPNATMDAFLEPEMRILSLVTHIASCTHFRYHHLQLQKNPSIWLRIDVNFGIAKRLPQSAVHELYESIQNQTDSDFELNPLIFHQWQLSNDTDNAIFPHIDEFADLAD